ncbi:glycoside hydrolase family 6 protein [Streptomyces sp. NPDC051315]|uniref:glycoside hydrolase family 6 protein n=1 Tax=Streptomyces sp. NPDC051315 TaxID=3365650 RepID=UPI00378E8724
MDALGGPSHRGAVIGTARNGDGPPAEGQWCDPDGRGPAGPPPAPPVRVDACPWWKPPGESDGRKGAAGTLSPSYAYERARGSVSRSPW